MFGNYSSGEVIDLVPSEEFGRLIRDAIGTESLEKIAIEIGVSKTYVYDWAKGVVPSEQLLSRFCQHRGVEIGPFWEAARKVRPRYDPEKLLLHFANLYGLTNAQRMKLMQMARQMKEETAASKHAA